MSATALRAVRVHYDDTFSQWDTDSFVYSLIRSSNDVPRLLNEIESLRTAYADLVAACRAAILAERDGDPDSWEYIAQELPPAPAGHPLAGDAE